MTKELEIMPTTVETNYDGKDLVTLAVAQGERVIRKRIKDGMIVIKGMHDQLKKKKDAFEKGCATFISPLIKSCKEMNKVLGKHKTTVKMQLKKEIITIREDNGDDVTKIRHTIHTSDRYDSVTFVQETFELSASLKKMEKVIDTLKEQLADKQEEILNEKRKLADIPSLERQMHAKIIEVQLNKTVDGRKLLKQLTDNADLDNTIKLLGV